MFLRKNNGFNLIILSSIILILATIMSAAIGFYNINNLKNRISQNKEKFDKIELAIQNYVVKNERFPCPAPLNCDESGCVAGSQKLGIEVRSGGNCSADDAGIFANSSQNTFYGNVPAVSLGISNNYAVDTWGNKIVYIISGELTSNGALKNLIIDREKGTFKSYVTDGILYVLISFNKNTPGAFYYNSRKSNYFPTSTKENMPINDFTVNIDNNKYFYNYKNISNFRINGLDEELPNCPSESFEVFDFGGQDTCVDFFYTGSVQEFTHSKGSGSVKIEVWGAKGGGVYSGTNNKGGNGGYSYGYYDVPANKTLYVYVGGAGTSSGVGGWNGGVGKHSSALDDGAGGGATDVRLVSGDWNNAASLASRIIVAGGGGGASEGTPNKEFGGYGGGGNSNGGNGGIGEGTEGQGGGTQYCKKLGSSGAALGGGGYYGGGANVCPYYGGITNSCIPGTTGRCGGGGGGSGYIGGVTNGGGANGDSDDGNNGPGKATICYDSSDAFNRLTFREGKYGEIVFSNELCPKFITNPPKASNFYYYSTYRDHKEYRFVIPDNRAAKRCGKNGKWENGFVYSCATTPKCPPPSTFRPFEEWGAFNFEVANTGVVHNVDETMTIRCLLSVSGDNIYASWFIE